MALLGIVSFIRRRRRFRWAELLLNVGTGNIHDFTFDYCTLHILTEVIHPTLLLSDKEEMKDASVKRSTNNIFYDNAIPIYINSYYSLDASNSYHNPDNPSETNRYNGILVFGGNKERAVCCLWRNRSAVCIYRWRKCNA